MLISPKALSIRINNNDRAKGGSHFYSLTGNGLATLIADPGKRNRAADNALAKVRAALAHVCMSAPNVTGTMQNTGAVLGSLYRATGWTPTFRWQQQAPSH